MPLAVEELDTRRHDPAGFDCGVEVLNRYLKNLAAQHRAKGIATTFVLADPDQPDRILGYYTLSAATLSFETLTEADRKGLPAYPIPAVRIGRLAGAASARRQGTGELLLQNAIKRILQARGTLGVFAVVVEAKDAAADAFYRKYGFRLCNAETRQFYLPLGAGWISTVPTKSCDGPRGTHEPDRVSFRTCVRDPADRLLLPGATQQFVESGNDLLALGAKRSDNRTKLLQCDGDYLERM